MARVVVAALLLLLAGLAPDARARAQADAGALRIAVRDARVVVSDARGRVVLAAAPRGLAARFAGGTARATRVRSVRGRTVVLDTDRPGTTLSAAVRRDGAGVVGLRVAARGARAVSLTFARGRGERFLGFGERSDAVVRDRGTVVNRVEDGPHASRADLAAVTASIPPWGLGRRRDSTYFPLPWILSTRGHGVLVDDDETSRFTLGRATWTAEVDAPRLTLRVFAGPRPADALRRLTARLGRQPAPTAPWLLGPWFQTGHQNDSPGELGYADVLRAADAPVSVAETHLRYLPCGARQEPGREASERARTAAFRARGFATVTYLNSEVCADTPLFARTAAAGGLQRRRDGAPYVFRAFVGGRAAPVGQFDFARPAGIAGWSSVADLTVADGHDGFMEDYGEYTPRDSVTGAGVPGTVMHNRYPVLYHRAGWEWARRQPRGVVRFTRSGWTGAAPYVQVVWGGDPATGWGFDGLRSALRQGLSMGLSGIGIWGSDIGGFFTLSGPRLTPELLARWIQLGLVSGVMRTKAEGIGVGLADRPQIWEQPTLPIWRRYAKLRTQLHPYLTAAAATYRRTGLPLMRALTLAAPGDPRALRDDELLLGSDLLAAPVLAPGVRSRRVFLPRGRWVPLWASVRERPGDRSLDLRRATTVAGGRTITAAAPLAELPLFARAGALLPLLPGDVDTLAPYGRGAGLVKLSDRRDRLRVLAFPRGRSRARFDLDGRLASTEGAGRWTLTLRARRPRAVELQASLATLRRPFRPCRVTGVRSWRYDPTTRVLSATLRGRSARVSATACR